MLVQLRKILILAVLILIVGALIFLGVKSVLEIKTGDGNGDEGLITIESEGDVVGIPDVPAYPGSTFMFKDDIENEVVQRFLSSGLSAYVLPMDTEWNQVVSFYNDELSQAGWEHAHSIELADELCVPGEYWVFKKFMIDEAGNVENELDPIGSFGLRIYSKINGVWYEKLTVGQAQTCLSNEVAREREIELMLSMGSSQELPETFPWKLTYPEIWSVEVSKSGLIDAPFVEFSNVNTVGTVLIEPIAFDIGTPLREEGNVFLDQVNGRRAEENKLLVVSSKEITIADQSGIRFNLESELGTGWMAVVVHPENGIIYSITALEGDEAFFNYVVENLSL